MADRRRPREEEQPEDERTLAELKKENLLLRQELQQYTQHQRDEVSADSVEELKKENILLREEVERLTTPPFTAGTIMELGEKTIRVSIDNFGLYEIARYQKPKQEEKGEKLDQNPGEELDKQLRPGLRVVLSPSTRAIVSLSEFPPAIGELTIVDQVIDGRLKVNVKGEQRVIYSGLKEAVKAGDEVLLDSSGMIAVGKSENKRTKYHLEEVPNAPWENVGGLELVVDSIRQEIEQPFLNKEVYARYGRKPAKGILLYGPPGCGKTLIARSIAFNLAALVNGGKANGHFINVKGPEILEKWVGNSEANIRRIYQTARETAEETKSPVVVFIDEAESVFKARGTGISTDVYDSIVPQFLAELDGINGNGNVITVLATNREDILDPAVLRDGRIDRRIKVSRPSKEGAAEIFRMYLKGKPLEKTTEEELVKGVVEEIYSPERVAYRVVSPREGEMGYFGFRHLISGAMIKGIVDRACGYAIRREVQSKKKSGITREDFARAAVEEFSDNMGFAQALVKDDWEDIFGAKGKYLQDLYRQGYIIIERADGKGNVSEAPQLTVPTKLRTGGK